ncbi:MAG: helix-turn-helix transcriptional regulator [Candidatus Altiarchaeota archaeon]|nr:helix-turn-helix transcriptional regulator [Candidatus Altiarchaeota archaeon]
MEKLRVREDVLRLKALISEPRNLRVRNEAEEYLTQLQELGFRIEELEKRLESKDSGVSYKRKKQMVAILRSGKKTSTEIGRILKISRTRSSEYLNGLEKDGIVMSVRVDRKKYYSLKGESL